PTCPPCSSAPLRPPPLPTLFPYTTLFRSHPPVGRGHLNRSAGHRAARTRQPRSDGPPEYRTDLGDRPARPTRFGMNLCRKHFCAATQRCPSRLRDDLVHDAPVDVGEPEVAPGITKRQPSVIQAEQIEDRGM